MIRSRFTEELIIGILKERGEPFQTGFRFLSFAASMMWVKEHIIFLL